MFSRLSASSSELSVGVGARPSQPLLYLAFGFTTQYKKGLETLELPQRPLYVITVSIIA